MLANFICDTYTDFSTIDWPEVAARSEFVGHTEYSLRRMYLNTLSRMAGRRFGLIRGEVTPQHIAEYCELVVVYGKDRGSGGSNKMQRQWDVTSYFEMKVVELGLKSFV